MSLLHNRISNKELKEKLYQENFSRTTISFYKYCSIQNPQVFRDELYKGLSTLQCFGRIYIAKEGINAQMSVPSHLFENFKEYLYTIPELNELRLNIAVNDNGKSFWALRIKTREKIVADGIEDPSFSMENKGNYVDAQQMNSMLNSEDTIVIDMRNHYEFEVGHFTNAIEIPSDTFREQLPMAADMMKDKKEANIIMYCTGGIRCEKASAYMLHHGFKNVFHLEGGIINYANKIKEAGLESKFKGKNFVFDDRLGEKLQKILLRNVINVVRLVIRIRIVKMMAVICYSYNVPLVPKPMRVVVHRLVKILFICPWKSKLSLEKGLTKDSKFSTKVNNT